jgi:PAT family beta-lactamase induction signal transducer AmpG
VPDPAASPNDLELEQRPPQGPRGAPSDSRWAAKLRQAAAVYAIGAVRRMFVLGFAAGLPLPLVFGTLSFRLREAGVDLATIGFVSWVALAYGFKWAWSPLIDQIKWPLLARRLGQRRSWLLVAQVAVMIGLLAMAAIDPAHDLRGLVYAALLTAFASATQDIALDAYRIESAPIAQQATLAAAYQAGYRIALIWAGAGALWLAASADAGATSYQAASWRFAYMVMAATMLVGVVAVLMTPEAGASRRSTGDTAGNRLRAAVVEPLADFARRYRWHAPLLLGLVATYRLPDIIMGVMANPFYRDLGFTKLEVAAVSKVFGVAMTIAGALVGGGLAPRIGILATLLIGAIGASASNLLYAALAVRGHDMAWFTFAVSIDNLSTGIAGSAFIAYLSSLTNLRFAATQYALLSSMMLLLPKYVAGFGGTFVERFGYPAFFCTAAALGAPAWILIGLVARTKIVGGRAGTESDPPQGAGKN